MGSISKYSAILCSFYCTTKGFKLHWLTWLFSIADETLKYIMEGIVKSIEKANKYSKKRTK